MGYRSLSRSWNGPQTFASRCSRTRGRNFTFRSRAPGSFLSETVPVSGAALRSWARSASAAWRGRRPVPGPPGPARQPHSRGGGSSVLAFRLRGHPRIHVNAASSKYDMNQRICSVEGLKHNGNMQLLNPCLRQFGHHELFCWFRSLNSPDYQRMEARNNLLADWPVKPFRMPSTEGLPILIKARTHG